MHDVSNEVVSMLFCWKFMPKFRTVNEGPATILSLNSMMHGRGRPDVMGLL